jgi:mono/diheme cytochrome c family protein
MKKTIVIFLTAFMLYSCAKRMTPATTSPVTTSKASSEVKADNLPAPAPPPMATAEPTIPATLEETKPIIDPSEKKETKQVVAGKETFNAKCGRCHDLKTPETYTAAKWVKIIDWMAPKAKLDESEKENVLAYVSFYAKA